MSTLNGDVSGGLQGRTADGVTFPMPTVKHPFALSWDWVRQLSLADAVLFLSGLNLLLWWFSAPFWVMVAVFVFWRAAYNVGLGWLLHQQSNTGLLTKKYKDIKAENGAGFRLLTWLIKSSFGPDFVFDDYPDEFIAWMSWRKLVDLVLYNDAISYVTFVLLNFTYPEQGVSMAVVARWGAGALLCMFSMWSKADAYRVIGSFAWYWGDFFFLVPADLKFNRVFGIAPHPMYTLGYGWYYGLSLMSGSYAVFLVSLCAHMSQMLFLVLAENPHIEKTYNSAVAKAEETTESIAGRRGFVGGDLLIFRNFNPYRASDLFMVFIVWSSIVLALFSSLEYGFFLLAALVCRAVHSGLIGYILLNQSRSNSWMEGAAKRGMSQTEAFDNWKRFYNLSMVMTHVTFGCFAVQNLEVAKLLTLEGFSMGLIGFMFGALNVWSSVEIHEAVGDFGWFYGDFFIPDLPTKVQYSGIYRYLNNPENTLGFCGYYGCAVATQSWDVLVVAIVSHVAHYAFVMLVETPHMVQKYGQTNIRDKAGVESTVNEIFTEMMDNNAVLKTVVSTLTSKLPKKSAKKTD